MSRGSENREDGEDRRRVGVSLVLTKQCEQGLAIDRQRSLRDRASSGEAEGKMVERSRVRIMWYCKWAADFWTGRALSHDVRATRHNQADKETMLSPSQLYRSFQSRSEQKGWSHLIPASHSFPWSRRRWAMVHADGILDEQDLFTPVSISFEKVIRKHIRPLSSTSASSRGRCCSRQQSAPPRAQIPMELVEVESQTPSATHTLLPHR